MTDTEHCTTSGSNEVVIIRVGKVRIWQFAEARINGKMIQTFFEKDCKFSLFGWGNKKIDSAVREVKSSNRKGRPNLTHHYKRFATASTSAQVAVLPWRYIAEMSITKSLHAST